MYYQKFIERIGLSPVESKLTPDQIQERYSSLLKQYNELLIKNKLPIGTFERSLREVLDDIASWDDFSGEGPGAVTKTGQYWAYRHLSRLATESNYDVVFGCEREIAACILTEILEFPPAEESEEE